MSNIHDAIANESIEEESVTAVEQEAAVAEPTEQAPPKAMTLDDALAKAFEKHAPEEDEKPKTALPGSLTTTATPGKTVDPITGRESEPMKAPAGWTPLLREKWTTVDPTVQKFIHDREREMAQNFTKTADDRKLAAEVKELFSPYESTIRQFGISGVQLTRELMTQWHGLQTGDDVQKAHIIVGLLNHFRPSPQAFQQALAGQAPAQTQAAQRAPDVSELVKAELAKRDEEFAMDTANKEIATFSADPRNEFFGDVHDLMKRILEAQLVDGPDLPTLLKKAYDLACTQHPEINQIVSSRAPVVAAQAVQRATVKPVGSVKASPGTGKPSKSAPRNMSLDDAINEAVSRHVK